MTNELQKYQAETQVEAELKSEVSALIAEANKLNVRNDNDLSYATDVVKLIKDQTKQLESERLKITSPLNAVLKHVNSRFKILSEPLDKAETKIKVLISGYLRNKQAAEFAEQQRLRKIAEDNARTEAARLAKQNKPEEAAQIQAHAEEIKNAEIVPIKQNISGAATGAKTYITKRWVFKVTDIQTLVAAHPEFILVDNVAVNKAIAAGARDIHGLEIYQEESVSVR